MKHATRVALVVLAAASSLAGPPLAADQGKSGDSSDWGCGGHPPTTASSRGENRASISGLNQLQGQWRNWWYLNRSSVLDVSYRVAEADAKPAMPERWRDDVRAALLVALDSSVTPLAAEAALALGRGGDARDIAILAKTAGDPRARQEIRRRAALGLGLMPVEEGSAAKVRDTLLAVTRESIGNNDDRLLLWSNAVYALGLRGDGSVIPRLAEFIERHRDASDSDHVRGVHREVMASAIGTLGLFRNSLLLPDLEETLSDSSGSANSQKRKAMFGVFAAYGLARVGDVAALPALCQAVSDERLDVRRGALLAIGALAGPDDAAAIAVLSKSAADEQDEGARSMAVLSLGRTGAKQAPGILRAAYASASPTVRSYAALGLGLFARRKSDPGVQDFLLAELEGKHSTEETGALAIANGLAVNLPAARRLTEIARAEGETVMRSHAAFALGLLGVESASPQVLLDLVAKGDPVIRHEAALALGLARRREGVDALIGIVEKGERLPERASAAVALGRIAGAEAAPVLTKLLRDEREANALRVCAAHGLGLLLDRSEGRTLSRAGADVNWINETNARWLQTEMLDQLLLIMD